MCKLLILLIVLKLSLIFEVSNNLLCAIRLQDINGTFLKQVLRIYNSILANKINDLRKK